MKIRKEIIYLIDESGKLKEPDFLEMTGSNINSILTTFNKWLADIYPIREGTVKVEEDDEKFSISITKEDYIEKYTIWKIEGWSNIKLEHNLTYVIYGGEGPNTVETIYREYYYDTADTLERLIELRPLVEWDCGDAYFCQCNFDANKKLVGSIRVITRFKLNYVS